MMIIIIIIIIITIIIIISSSNNNNNNNNDMIVIIIVVDLFVTGRWEAKNVHQNTKVETVNRTGMTPALRRCTDKLIHYTADGRITEYDVEPSTPNVVS